MYYDIHRVRSRSLSCIGSYTKTNSLAARIFRKKVAGGREAMSEHALGVRVLCRTLGHDKKQEAQTKEGGPAMTTSLELSCKKTICRVQKTSQK